MAKIHTCSALLLCWMNFLSQPVFAAPPEHYNFLPLTEALEQVATKNKPMLLYFGRYGCSICLNMHKEVFSDSTLRQKMSDRFVLAYVDIESGKRIRLANGERTTEMQFASRSRLIGTPTFIYFSSNLKPLFKKVGFQTVLQMLQYSDFVSEAHFKSMDLEQYLINQ